MGLRIKSLGTVAFLGLASVSLQPLLGQYFELGAIGTASTFHKAKVSDFESIGKVGPGLGPGIGIIFGQTLRGRWAGEARYLYMQNDYELESGDVQTELSGQAHLFSYAVMYYLAPQTSRVVPFVAAGAGWQYYQGTGTERPDQPLSNLALLTRATQNMATGEVGGGIKIQLGERVMLRVEFRDYFSGVPKNIIANTREMEGIWHRWTPIFGVTWKVGSLEEKPDPFPKKK